MIKRDYKELRTYNKVPGVQTNYFRHPYLSKIWVSGSPVPAITLNFEPELTIMATVCYWNRPKSSKKGGYNKHSSDDIDRPFSWVA